MKIGFFGAAKEVTGSKHLIYLNNGQNFLLDCGMFQGSGDEIDAWNNNFGFNARDVHFMILSHAHIDHSGLIPKLVKEGFHGAIYTTPATKDLCEIMLEDSARIQEGDVKYINKKRELEGLPLLKPLYELEDVEAAIKLFKTVPYNQLYQINENVSLKFIDNGHILGSASVNLLITEEHKLTRLTFTGDIGRYNNKILETPKAFPQADYIICESTYGDKIHDPDPNLKYKLLEIIRETCVNRKGKLIIPAFSIGRTQEVLSALNDLEYEHKLPPIKTYVDSPLSEKATKVVFNHPECFNERMKQFMKEDKDPFKFDGLTFIQNKKESQALNDREEACIIISASGMAEAGRVKHHILHAIGSSKNAILFVGYCSPYSLGGRLINGAREVKIFGTMFHVHARVKKLNGFSAHGDYTEMIRFLSSQNAAAVKNIFLVHGDEDVMHVYQNHLSDAGFNKTYIPSYKEIISIVD
jgi:metallo-beta-lactamase family protein